LDGDEVKWAGIFGIS
jgi:hypothetical protein